MRNSQAIATRPGGYQLHRLAIPDLNAELLRAWELGQHDAEKRAAELGITVDIINKLQMGAKLIVPEGRRFRPATDDEAGSAIWASVMPTSWDGCRPYDLMAISPEGFWLRLGLEQWLGDPAEGPYFTKVLAWLRAGGKGSCWIGGCDE